MLYGTSEELEYHARRAQQEESISHQSEDASVTEAHIRLAELHRARLEVVSALLSQPQDRSLYAGRADKEA